MHARGFFYGDHTTGSYIAQIGKGMNSFDHRRLHPCLALFKPYWMIDGEKFSFGPEREDEAAGFWRRRERLHRAVLENRLPDLEAYLAERDRLEESIDARVASLQNGAPPREKLLEIMAWALAAEEELLAKTLAGARTQGKIKGWPYFKCYWKKQTASLERPRRG